MKTRFFPILAFTLTLGLGGVEGRKAVAATPSESASAGIQEQAAPDGPVPSLQAGPDRNWFWALAPWLVVGASGLLSLMLLRQNGRILLRLDALERQAAQPKRKSAGARPEGLPVGSQAPDFDLPELDGGNRKLADFRGRKVLLAFFSPQCGYCVKMVPKLVGLGAEGVEGGPLPVVITTGEVEVNRKLLRDQGVRCPILLQEGMKVASTYKVLGTPMGYLLDEQGAIASQLAAGDAGLMALANPNATAGLPESESQEQAPTGDAAAPARPNGKLGKGLAHSRIKRDGLEAGTLAPPFTLPLLDGGEVSLGDYRGRRLLLVFSDPECAPCERVASHLERIHRERTDLEVLMVSRRDPEANRRKAATLGLSFPIALQKSWEISMLYAMFATPLAYLIDEEGGIISDAAKGVEPILALASQSTARPGSTTPARSAQDRKELVMA